MVLLWLNKPKKKLAILHEVLGSNNWLVGASIGLEKIPNTSNQGKQLLSTLEWTEMNVKVILNPP